MLYVRGSRAARWIITSESHYPSFLDKKTYPDVDRDNPKTENDREKSELSRGDLLRPFNMPNFLSSDICTDANGYFGCRGTYDQGGKLESYSTLFFKAFGSSHTTKVTF
jgi:hypothetical protein